MIVFLTYVFTAVNVATGGFQTTSVAVGRYCSRIFMI